MVPFQLIPSAGKFPRRSHPCALMAQLTHLWTTFQRKLQMCWTDTILKSAAPIHILTNPINPWLVVCSLFPSKHLGASTLPAAPRSSAQNRQLALQMLWKSRELRWSHDTQIFHCHWGINSNLRNVNTKFRTVRFQSAKRASQKVKKQWHLNLKQDYCLKQVYLLHRIIFWAEWHGVFQSQTQRNSDV